MTSQRNKATKRTKERERGAGGGGQTKFEKGGGKEYRGLYKTRG